TERVVCFLTSSSPYKGILAISIYQSQKSSQMKLYRLRPASPNSYLSVFRVTCSIVSFSRVKIHLSASDKSPVKSISSYVKPSRFINAKRDAFHILFAKFQVASTFSHWKRKSCPGVDPVKRKYLNESAPYLSITSIGPTQFSRDLLIFRPSASMINPCTSTSFNGRRPVNAFDWKIIRATQKKMMS